jgi:hypothetical protein
VTDDRLQQQAMRVFTPLYKEIGSYFMGGGWQSTTNRPILNILAASVEFPTIVWGETVFKNTYETVWQIVFALVSHQKPLAIYRKIANQPEFSQVGATEPPKYADTRFGTKVIMGRRLLTTKTFTGTFLCTRRWRHMWSIEGWIHNKRRNRLAQQNVERAVRAHDNLVLRKAMLLSKQQKVVWDSQTRISEPDRHTNEQGVDDSDDDDIDSDVRTVRQDQH